MVIGVLSKNYAARRLFLDKLPDAKYKDVRFYNWHLWANAHLWFLRMIGKLNMSPEEAAAKLFYDYSAIFPLGVDVLHFFNTINHDGHIPWVASVESAIPWSLEVTRCVESANPDFTSLRNNKYVRSALDDLAKPNCLALMALSQCSLNIQKQLINKVCPIQEGKIILNKLIKLLPPQSLKVNSVDEKGLSYCDDETFQFIYVGRNFLRKGGRDTIEVFCRLREKCKCKFKLTIISSLEGDEKKYERTGNDFIQIKQLINDNSDWIEWHGQLPNSKVLEMVKKSHVALLPTWMDTFAYSVLECQACGTPVISTSLRALTEINDESVGYLINVPVNELNNPVMNNREQFKVFEKMLQNGLEQKIMHVLEHRDEVRKKSTACIERIRKDYSPEKYTSNLRLLYKGKVDEVRAQFGE